MRQWSVYLVLFAGLNAGCGTSTPTGVPPKPPARRAPPDRPLHAQGSAQEEEQQAAIAPYVEKARKTYPAAKKRYLDGLPQGDTFFAVTRIRDRSGASEQVFVIVDAIQDGRIHGRIASDLFTVRGFHTGERYSFPEDELLDWLIRHPDGKDEGNVVGEFVEEWQKTRRRR